MRGLVILGSLMATLVHAAMNGYVEVRDFELPAAGIDTLAIDAGAGSLSVTGDTESRDIRVSATIEFDNVGADEALERIEQDLVLRLERDGSRALLESHFRDRLFARGEQGVVHLEVQVPRHLALAVDDGSGSMKIDSVDGDVRINDGSGPITLTGLGGAVEVDDGSGSIDVRDVLGDLTVDDGSGAIRIASVSGSVMIDDGSGGIDVRDVGRDLVIVDAGSGSVRYSGIAGVVDYDEE